MGPLWKRTSYANVAYIDVLLTTPFLDSFQREIHVCVHKNVRSSTIHDNLTLEVAQMLINTIGDKCFVAQLLNGILHNNKNE